MKDVNEQLSAIVDNEFIDEKLIDELLINKDKQELFSRYHLIGDVMRGDITDQFINFDISQQVMAKIEQPTKIAAVVELDTPTEKSKNNVISFVKRFGQYAIAASVAGVVVLASLVTSEPTFQNNSAGLEVLKTVPLGAANPVSLQTTKKQSQQEVKKHNDRLEALLNDHQLQLQTQP
ncbi:anti sigma-E protein, RseA [Psychromonas ingrahamii 37]|uniref:Anti-sigma-E factor RseA n=1 Tax=Psychromonas ingrahamii (strain DSM 17664 / CCUG 51855 / 37) TaxID=357804 RepID=A1SR25_PSYIN|nr:RseA family anti-sigma factor [Psychromonas ingrahamii]ABM01940.1 anti sigma-E protein, RseA [Psychromonas ingrahamii 37]